MLSRIGRRIADNSPPPIVIFVLFIYRKICSFFWKEKVYDLGDFRMNIDQSESRMMVKRKFRSYESEVSDIITDELDRGSTYIDIGSNKGYHVLEAASIVGNEGIVYSFEPNPDNFSDLRENIELNGFGNVRIYEKAVYDKNGTSSFSFGAKSGYGSVSQEGDVKIETVTLDNFLHENNIDFSSIDLIKIDVEGGEASVIDGMTEFLNISDNCTIIVEIHPTADIQRMSRILHENGCGFKKHNDEYWLITT